MTDLEDRLRRDLQQVSERAGPGSIRPLRDPLDRRRPRAVRWLAPVAAVAAVIGVVAGVSLASRSQGHRSAPLQSPAPQPEPVGPMPPYYVTLAETYPQNAPWAYVRDSATGAVLTSVHLPALVTPGGGSASPSITAAGDNRTYIITVNGGATASTSGEGVHHGTVSRYYLLRVAADGRSARLTALDIPISPDATDRIALSPDGSMVATAIQACQRAGCQYTGIQVVTLATGASRTWTTSAGGAPFSVSWAGNGHIAFQWHQGYRLLNATRPGTNLLAGSVPIAGPAPVAGDYGYVPPALVTSDGRAVITSTVQNVPEGNGHDTVVAKIIELDASTGQLLAVLHTAIARDVTTQQDTVQTNVSDLDQTCQVLSLASTGVHALIQCFGFGRVDGTRFTALPGVPNPNATTVSGSDIWGTGAW